MCKTQYNLSKSQMHRSCVFVLFFSRADLHCPASSHSGNIRALMQERKHVEIPGTLQNLPECNGL